MVNGQAYIAVCKVAYNLYSTQYIKVNKLGNLVV